MLAYICFKPTQHKSHCICCKRKLLKGEAILHCFVDNHTGNICSGCGAKLAQRDTIKDHFMEVM